MHIVALIHLPKPNDPINGRDNVTVIEIHLCALDLALIGLHRPFVLMNKRNLRVQRLARNRVLCI